MSLVTVVVATDSYWAGDVLVPQLHEAVNAFDRIAAFRNGVLKGVPSC